MVSVNRASNQAAAAAWRIAGGVKKCSSHFFLHACECVGCLKRHVSGEGLSRAASLSASSALIVQAPQGTRLQLIA